MAFKRFNDRDTPTLKEKQSPKKNYRFSVGSTIWRIFANEEAITELWKKKTIVCSLHQVHLEASVNADLTLHGLH